VHAVWLQAFFTSQLCGPTTLCTALPYLHHHACRLMVPWSSACYAGDLQALDDVRKLDTTNSAQMELMHTHFSHNMAAVDFWLNSCIFPTETQQYPQRLVANAWNLADNSHGQVVGFSGTNDNHRLLPKQVEQHLEVEATLRATNGKMLAVMLDNPQYDTLVLQVRQSGADMRACDMYCSTTSCWWCQTATA
jgi:hypothetical protein